MYSTRLEGVADEVVTATGCDDPPVDAIEVAACCGLRVEFCGVRHAVLYDDVIYVTGTQRAVLTQLYIAHEIGHWALRRADMPWLVEEDATYIAGAILVPWRTLVRDVRRGWDLDALRAKYETAPASVIASRIAMARDGTAAIYDEGRLRRRVGPPHRLERELARAALESAEPVRVDDLTGAWPVFDGGRRRVIVLASNQ